ncbi:hypothetical protein [Streptomyces sparsus]
MKSRRSLVGSVVAATVLSAGLIGTAAPAYAAPGKAVGSCVKTTPHNKAGSYTVQVTNKCKKTVRVKVVMKLGKDHPCTSIKAGKNKFFHSKGLATWKKTVYC